MIKLKEFVPLHRIVLLSSPMIDSNSSRPLPAIALVQLAAPNEPNVEVDGRGENPDRERFPVVIRERKRISQILLMRALMRGLGVTTVTVTAVRRHHCIARRERCRRRRAHRCPALTAFSARRGSARCRRSPPIPSSSVPQRRLHRSVPVSGHRSTLPTTKTSLHTS